jgi:hypothetical protein
VAAVSADDESVPDLVVAKDRPPAVGRLGGERDGADHVQDPADVPQRELPRA